MHTVTEWRKTGEVRTLGDGQETYRHNGLTMSSAHVVCNVAEAHIERVELLITGGYGYCCLVRTKNDWCQHGTNCLRELGNLILPL